MVISSIARPDLHTSNPYIFLWWNIRGLAYLQKVKTQDAFTPRISVAATCKENNCNETMHGRAWMCSEVKGARFERFLQPNFRYGLIHLFFKIQVMIRWQTVTTWRRSWSFWRRTNSEKAPNIKISSEETSCVWGLCNSDQLSSILEFSVRSYHRKDCVTEDPVSFRCDRMLFYNFRLL